MVPRSAYGVPCMSMAFLMPPDSPAIWRGPMVMGALETLMTKTAWGSLDALVLDMPPGTGDAALTVTQRLHLSGAVIVSTPQDIALLDARRGALMFRKVGVPVLGIVENMSHFVCPCCGTPSRIFGAGGVDKAAHDLHMPVLGQVSVAWTWWEPAGLEGGWSLPRPVPSRACGEVTARLCKGPENVGPQEWDQAPHMPAACTLPWTSSARRVGACHASQFLAPQSQHPSTPRPAPDPTQHRRPGGRRRRETHRGCRARIPPRPGLRGPGPSGLGANTDSEQSGDAAWVIHALLCNAALEQPGEQGGMGRGRQRGRAVPSGWASRACPEDRCNPAAGRTTSQ